MAGIECAIRQETRLCKVDGKFGWFHAWEHFSKPIEASPMIGGAPAGIFSKIFGIVELADGVRRVDPTDIHFCDNDNGALKNLDEKKSGDLLWFDYKVAPEPMKGEDND